MKNLKIVAINPAVEEDPDVFIRLTQSQEQEKRRQNMLAVDRRNRVVNGALKYLLIALIGAAAMGATMLAML